MSASNGDSSAARRVPTSTRTAVARHSRILIGPGWKPWGGNLTQALEELTAIGGIVMDVRISGNINGEEDAVQDLTAEAAPADDGAQDTGGRSGVLRVNHDVDLTWTGAAATTSALIAALS
jgi:hypothetical protein